MKVRAYYKQQLGFYTSAIATYFPKETRISRPKGGFLLWIELPEAINTIQLFQDAFKKNLTIAPGPMFSVNQAYGNFLRLNYSYPWTDEIKNALKTLGELAKSQL